jgi:hypothetical protein
VPFWFAGGAAVGVGTGAYIEGELKSTEEVSLDKAWEATQKAMEDLELIITYKGKDAISGEVMARRASGKKITVKLRKESDSFTEIRIRVGIFGNESVSHEVHKTIKKHF